MLRWLGEGQFCRDYRKTLVALTQCQLNNGTFGLDLYLCSLICSKQTHLCSNVGNKSSSHSLIGCVKLRAKNLLLVSSNTLTGVFPVWTVLTINQAVVFVIEKFLYIYRLLRIDSVFLAEMFVTLILTWRETKVELTLCHAVWSLTVLPCAVLCVFPLPNVFGPPLLRRL